MKREEARAAFGAFFEREADGLQRFATFMSGNADLAADLAQEALTQTYRAWHRIPLDDPAAYARRVVVNQLRDRQRRERVRRLKPLGVLPHSTASREGESLDRMSMTDLLKALSPVQRAVLVLRFYDDMTERQISDVLDRPIGTIKSDLRRALKRLRPLVMAERQEAGGSHGS